MRRHSDYFAICPQCDARVPMSLVAKLQAASLEVTCECRKCRKEFPAHASMIFSTEDGGGENRSGPSTGATARLTQDEYFGARPVDAVNRSTQHDSTIMRIDDGHTTPHSSPLRFVPGERRNTVEPEERRRSM
jgi:hypothetical protein